MPEPLKTSHALRRAPSAPRIKKSDPNLKTARPAAERQVLRRAVDWAERRRNPGNKSAAARAERELGMAENQAFQDAFNISVQTNALGELGRRLGLVSLDASNVGGGDNRPIISELRLRPSALAF